MEEVWKIVDGFPDYKISTFGNIMSKKWGDWVSLHPYPDSDGYLRVCISNINKKRFWFSIHRLMGMAFIPNPDNLPTVDHIDVDNTNNDLSNLRWATYKTQLMNRTITRHDITETDPKKRKAILDKELQQKNIDSKKYYCEMCNIACHCESALQEHLISIPHLRILNFKPTTADYCRPCGVNYQNKSHKQRHLEGPKHKRIMAAKNK
jgi:hypothetical protein